MSVRALVVDDEPLARERIRTLLDDHPDVVVVGEAADGPAAVRACVEEPVDLVFLDVQMPEMDGFEVIEALDRFEARSETGRGALPAVVFVTAYDRYALRAFDVHALDYLLKPFDRERFETTLERVREQLEGRRARSLNRRLMGMINEVRGDRLRPTSRHYRERFLVRSRGRVIFISAEEIDWIEAAGNYVALHVGEQQHLLRETMTALEKQLDPRRFQRIHRSAMVRLERVRELVPKGGGDYEVVLATDERLPLGRTYLRRVQRRLAAGAISRS